MAKKLPALTPITRIVKAAAQQQSGPLAEYGCRSYPIPAPGLDGLRIRFLYARVHSDDPGSPMWIGAPEYIVSIDAESGHVEELRQFHSSEAGLAADGWLGQDHSLERRAQPDFIEQESAMLTEYDLVLPGLAAGQQPLPEPARDAIPLLVARFLYLQEAPLAPYYERLGRWFFGRIAGEEQ